MSVDLIHFGGRCHALIPECDAIEVVSVDLIHFGGRCTITQVFVLWKSFCVGRSDSLRRALPLAP